MGAVTPQPPTSVSIGGSDWLWQEESTHWQRLKRQIWEIGEHWWIFILLIYLTFAFDRGKKEEENCATEWKLLCCSTGFYLKMAKTAVTRQAATQLVGYEEMQHFSVHESHLKVCHLTPFHSAQILRQSRGTQGTCHSVVCRHLSAKQKRWRCTPFAPCYPAQSLRKSSTSLLHTDYRSCIRCNNSVHYQCKWSVAACIGGWLCYGGWIPSFRRWGAARYRERWNGALL